LAIEILKRRIGITSSTGLRFAAPLAAAIAVGRLGCFFAGIEDRTYGNPTDLPWGHDFGDGISRHPVQLYEAIAMALFLAAFVPMLRRAYRMRRAPGFTCLSASMPGSGFYGSLSSRTARLSVH
jgi:phosphatidylglycerol:prolipoprotein diacylglycerol transferase